jgi:hypothetical protein
VGRWVRAWGVRVCVGAGGGRDFNNLIIWC